MTKLQELLTFKGRTSRLRYWRTQVVLLLAIALFWCGGLMLADVTGIAALGAIALVGVVPLYWPSLALLTRRLHDRNKSAWWIVPFQLAPVVLEVALDAHAHKDGDLLVGLMSLVGIALVIWGFVEIGLRRGTKGANQYGPDPLAAPAA